MTATNPATTRYVEHVMGMPISLALRGRHADDARGREAWAAVMATLHDVDAVFSTWRQDSYISRLGRGELTLAQCPREVAEVLALGAQAERDSGGAFAVRRPGSDGASVFDPSGVVKGWAADRAAEALRALPDTDFCLSAGGDIVCRSHDESWRIGIEDPHDPSRVIAVVPIGTGAVATSGSTHRGAHIVDARTGLVPEGIASVTVIGPSLTSADIDATAAYAMGRDGESWLATRGGHTWLIVWAHGSTSRGHAARRGPDLFPAARGTAGEAAPSSL